MQREGFLTLVDEETLGHLHNIIVSEDIEKAITAQKITNSVRFLG